MQEKIKKSLCILFLASIFSAVIHIPPVFADPTTLVSVKPSSVINPELEPCQTFIVNITVTNVTNLWDWQVKIYFDTSILDIPSAYSDVFLPPDHVFAYAPSTTGLSVSLNSGEGYVLAYNGLKLDSQPVDQFNGTGTLCQIRFHIVGRGSCNLQFDDVRTFLADFEGHELPFEMEHGYFDNRLPPQLATIYVDPPRIVNLTLVPCQNFTINVNIINATYLYSFEFKLGFSPTILNATGAELGDFFPPDVTPNIEINNTAGYLWFNASLHPRPLVLEGNGTLANVTFHVEGLGASNLTLYDTELADSAGDPLPHSTADGYFNNVLLAKLAVEPPEIINPALVPPATFEINITVADVEYLYGYEFNLSWDPDVLVCLGVIIHDVDNETNFRPEFIVGNMYGFVWINVTYYPPAEPITTYAAATLATIIFRVKAIGSTPLDLHDTSLTDPEGDPIPHEVEDGFFMTLVRDVAVIYVSPDLTEAYAGWTVHINVTVMNKGDMAETFDVNAYYDDDLIGTLTVTDLDPDENVTITFTWETEGVPACVNYTIKAVAGPVPYETNLTDNTYLYDAVKIKLMGDTNGDGIVDGRDLGLIARAFGSYPGHPRWEPDADLNQDDFIDGRDLGSAGRNFGKTC